jgi:hypothetical protein
VYVCHLTIFALHARPPVLPTVIGYDYITPPATTAPTTTTNDDALKRKRDEARKIYEEALEDINAEQESNNHTPVGGEASGLWNGNND